MRTRYKRTILKQILLTTTLTVSCLSVAQEREADLILAGGKIRTADGWVEAMAVKDGVIVALGDSDSVNRLKNADTEVIQLNGEAVLPGLHDMHVHPMGSGMMEQQCTFPQGSPPDVVLETIEKCANERSPGEWISGGQWDAASFGDTPPHRSMLDRVSPDNPVALIDISVHSLWVNSKALELAGIDENTPNPEGGIIERDENGVPTGVMRETAGGLVRGMIPPPTPEQSVEALKWSLDLILSHGITAFTDAGADEGTLRAYAVLADRGELKQRVRACQGWNPRQPEDLDQYNLRFNLYKRDRLNPDCIKIALDGVPTDGHTAAMLDPYVDSHGHGDEGRAKGILMVPPEQLKAALIAMDAKGFTVKMHAAGDAAVRAGLDAIEAAREANGFSGNLHDMAHNSFVYMSDIRRARGIAATFEMSPYIWFPNPIIPDIAKAVGTKRMKRFTPVKDALDAGALVVPGSDWAVVPSVNPWIGIETLVTRKQPGGDGEALGAVERITLEQAIDMYTINSARQMGTAHQTGQIALGLLADVIVVDRNPFEIPITEVHKTQVNMSIINGEVVYRAE